MLHLGAAGCRQDMGMIGRAQDEMCARMLRIGLQGNGGDGTGTWTGHRQGHGLDGDGMGAPRLSIAKLPWLFRRCFIWTLFDFIPTEPQDSWLKILRPETQDAFHASKGK